MTPVGHRYGSEASQDDEVTSTPVHCDGSDLPTLYLPL